MVLIGADNIHNIYKCGTVHNFGHGYVQRDFLHIFGRYKNQFTLKLNKHVHSLTMKKN